MRKRSSPTRAHDFATAVGGEQLVQEATLAVVNTLAPSSGRDEARALFEREHEEWRERDEPRSARALWGLAWVEFWAGNWELAAAARSSRARHLDPVRARGAAGSPSDCARGRPSRPARARARAFGAGPRAGRRAVRAPPAAAPGDPGARRARSGDASAGAEWLGRADRQAATLGLGRAEHSLVDRRLRRAPPRAGRIDDAVRILDVWEADAARLGREWVLAQVTRCRGLVAAPQGDVDRAALLLQQAVAQHEDVGDPFGRGSSAARARRSSGGARGKSAQRATPSRRRLTDSRRSGRPAGSPRRAPSSGASAGAPVRKG